MNKKLPNIYVNKIDKKHVNNKRVYNSSEKVEEKEEKREEKIKYEKNIHQKINEIFKSSKYVYKIDVIITTEEGEVSKKLIGKNSKNLITIDNELIPIESLKDIKFKD